MDRQYPHLSYSEQGGNAYTPRTKVRRRDHVERVKSVHHVETEAPVNLGRLVLDQYQEKSGLIRIAANFLIDKFRHNEQPPIDAALVNLNYDRPVRGVAMTINAVLQTGLIPHEAVVTKTNEPGEDLA